MKKDYVGLIFGNREIIKNECSDEDFLNNGLKLPSPTTRNEYKLTKCLNCGHILPASIKTIRRSLPKKCSFCSGISYKGTLTLNRNVYVEAKDCYEVIIAYKNTSVTAYIDKDDYEKVKQYNWRINQKKNKYYIVTGQSKNKTLLYLHNLIMNNYIHKDNYEVDHIDGNSLNNRKNNLRFLTRGDNARFVKARIDNKIGIRGVSFDKRSGKYVVDFSFQGVRCYFKQWNTLEEAVWCRYCAEEICSLETLKSNPLLKEYDTLNGQLKEDIYSYVLPIIKRNIWKQTV